MSVGNLLTVPQECSENHDMTNKLASEVQVGDVLVFRPEGDTLFSPDLRPTIYSKVEKVEHDTRRDGSVFVTFFVRPPRSMGHFLYFEADDKLATTSEITESCSINPDGLVLR